MKRSRLHVPTPSMVRTLCVMVNAGALLTGCMDALAAGMHGQVWRSTYSLQAKRTITETIDSDGAVTLRGIGPSVPWPDGKRYVFTDWDGSDGTLAVIDATSRKITHRMRFRGLLENLKPAPGRRVIAAKHGYSTLGPFEWVVLDVDQRQWIERFPASGGGFAWMSTDEYVIVSETGEVLRGKIGQRTTPVGHIDLPSGRTVADIWLDPRGTQLALRLDLRRKSGRSESDLWIFRIQGGSLHRLTSTQMATRAAWSPDGSRIAFEIDTGAWCAGSHCTGICEIWHAPATAREVRAERDSEDARRFTEMKDGRSRRMGCSLDGWTR